MTFRGAETLNSKDGGTFRSLAKFYESKNYKKGLKTAQKLLQTNPDHAQTYAMKALFQFNLGEQDKAIADCKTAILKSKMKSQMCWHTYGILLRQKRDYAEAVKCYQNALKMQPDNAQILRDTALLQIQIRDHSSHCNTRFEILKQKPSLVQNWVAYTIAKHLKGDFDDVVKSLSSLTNLMISSNLKPVEKSSFAIYKCIVYEDASRFEEFYNQIKKNEKDILDKVVLREMLARACIKINKRQQAEATIRSLIQEFPEDNNYFKLYQDFKAINNKSNVELTHFYSEIARDFSSKLAKIYQLNHIEDLQIFKRQFLNFVIPYYKKNLISLFSEIKMLYSQPLRAQSIGVVFTQLKHSLKQGKYPNGQQAESPSEYLWSLYLLSQHLSLKFETLPQSLHLINEAIQHTNTIPQLYMVKSQIQYRMHNDLESLQTVNEARKLDLADRYMNNLTVKYLLKCFKPAIAQDIMKLFIKEESSAYDLQNMWYEIELGKCYLKTRQFGPGFRHLQFIQKQFSDMYQDQFDFHTYSLRKWNLKEYLELIRYSDDIYNNKKYIEAAGIMIQYLIQYDNTMKQQKETLLPKGEQKQDQKKKKKKKKKQVQQEDPKQVYRKKIDYYGVKYLQALNNPLNEALNFAKNVVSAKYVNNGNENLNKLYFRAFGQCINLFIQLNKPLLCLKALKKQLKTNYNKQQQHIYLVKALRYLERVVLDQKLHVITRDIIKEELKNYLDGSANAIQYNEKVLSSWQKIYANQLRQLQIKLVIQEAKRADYIQLYKSELQRELQLKDILGLVHKLQFYGHFTLVDKQTLNARFNSKTTYFTDLSKGIDELHKTQWTNWWLSDYDKQREQIGKKQEEVTTQASK